MSKISTRKGLALGTVAALGFSALTGVAPAQAADLVTLVPTAGTSYNVPADESFSLDTYFASAAQSAASDVLKVKITDSTEGIALDAATAAIDFTTASAAADIADFAALDTTTKSVVTTTANKAAGIANKGTITLTPKASRTAKFSVEVFAWVDRDGNATYDSANGEVASATRTINFLTKSDITASVVLGDTIAKASTDASATVTFTPALNLELRDANADGSVAPSEIAGLAVKLAGVESTSYKLNANGTVTVTEATPVVAGTYTVEALLGTDSLGKASTTVVDNAPVAAKSTLALTAGVDAKADGTVRVGSTNHTATLALADTNGKALPAGVLVRITLDGTTQSHKNVLATASGATAADTVTVAGKSASTTADTKFDLKTDSAGKVSLPIVATGGTATTQVVIKVVVDGVTISPANGFKVIWTPASYTFTELTTVDAKNTDGAAGAATTKGLASTVGGSTSLKVAYVDQFGKAPANGTIRVKAVSTLRTAKTEYFPIVDGRATVTVTDEKTTATPNEIKTELRTESYDSASSSWGSASNVLATVFINPAAATTATVTLNANGTDNADLAAESATTALVPGDTRVGGTATLGTDGSGTTADQKATVSGVTSVASAPFTISGKGLVFSVDGVSSADSLSAYSGDAGEFAVDIYSNKTGTFTVTVASLGGTKTVDVVFTNLNTAGSVWSWVSTPDTIKSGRTLIVTAKLVDKFGNAVDADASKVAATYDGPGLPITSVLPSTTEADGTITFRYLLGADDAGAASVKFVYYGVDGVVDAATDTTPDDVVISKTILVGISASVSAGSKKANVVVKNATGLSVKVVSGTKSTGTKVATSDSYKLSLSKLTSGSKTVKVYVNGVLVVSKKVTVKK